MHLRSITLKGFKSFPDRTRLEFSPGVSVIVGPNGSGKSNITDAVLWALGEQSPLAVRGQTMQDVIFAGAAGLPARNLAEVEVVIEGAEGVGSEFSELSIARRIERGGEAEYRLNGARCRLVDVLEAMSDTGLGKEMHSVVSQGRVEAIVHSKARDRRLLIEEAAGLGKHRKRRRRAQLKLERTQENLDRALDVEREARSRLRPLKRQAEAAQLHERLERQSLEARLELAREDLRARAAALATAEAAVTAARSERDDAERELGAVAARRERAEEDFQTRAAEREQRSERLFHAGAALDGIELRRDRARENAAGAAVEAARCGAERERLLAAPAGGGAAGPERIATLEGELAELDRERSDRLGEELATLASELDSLRLRAAELERAAGEGRAGLAEAEDAALVARRDRDRAESALDAARSEAVRAAAELAAVEEFLRAAARGPASARPLADLIVAEPGYEQALAAVLGPRLRAAVVADLAAAESLLDAAGPDGGSALLASGGPACANPLPPKPGAQPLFAHVRGEPAVAAVVERLLANVWVVDDLRGLPPGFAGVVVTRAGRSLSRGELRQTAAGAESRLLEQRARREALAAAADTAERVRGEAERTAVSAAARVVAADGTRATAAEELAVAVRSAERAAEEAARAGRTLELRRDRPDEGEAALRRARVEAELAAERRVAETAARETEERERRVRALAGRVEHAERLRTDAERALAALEAAAAAVCEQRERLAELLRSGRESGDATSAELRACAHAEAALQDRLRTANAALTTAEVAAQHERDADAESRRELAEIAGRLDLEPVATEEPLADELRSELEARIARLTRRREQLGPVNPLAADEYEQAVDHVEELEQQRQDLESALTELQGLIKETDRRIREAFDETFAAAARNFEEVVGDLFPGGRGRLRLVHPDGPRPVIGGESPPQETADGADEAAAEAEEAAEAGRDEPGVEVEVTPAGKSMKRLSLLSGGEKSLVALAFMFAVFLARPCPFYILDEVEAALDDLNIDRFLALIARYSNRAQFIVVTHQKRTMDAADRIYGVSMAADGVSKVVSRRLADRPSALSEADPVADELGAAAAS